MLKLEARPQPSGFWSYGSPILALLLTVVIGVIMFVALGKDPLRGLEMFFWLPISSGYQIGELLVKASVARWSRTLATTFAAGVPLVEALDSVGPASGNAVYKEATKQIQSEVNMGTSLALSMQNSGVFPNMAVQMTSIGEESGSLDNMLGKVADYFEREVDDAVAALSSLLEPIIIVILGVLVGGLVIAMYLPIFKLGSVV